MRLQAGYLLHREGKAASSGGLTLLSPFRTSWVVLEQLNLTTVQLKFYHSRDEAENAGNGQQKPFRSFDFSVDDPVCVMARSKGTVFRLLRTRLAANSFEGVVEHVIDEFEPLSPANPPASQWVKSILAVLSQHQSNKQDSSQSNSKNKSEMLLPPAATSTPRARRQLIRINNGSSGSTDSGGAGDSSNLQSDVFSTSTNKSTSDISGIIFDPDLTNNQIPTNQRHISASSGVASSADLISNGSTNVCQLVEIVQTQRAEIARLERLLNSSRADSSGQNSAGADSTNASGGNNNNNSSGELSHGEAEILRLQKMYLKCRNRLGAAAGKAAASSADKFRWRQAYVQSIIGAMKIVVLEQRSVEKLELGLASIDLHAANIQALLSEAELPSLQKLASDGRYVDDFGFVHKFTSTDPQSADILNFAAGLLMDHFSAQTSYSTENETFWKIHIDMNKPLSEAALESALFHRHYIPERMRPDIWRLLLQNDVQAAKSKHRTDYYSLLARSAGFFGDLEADSSFLDSALTLLTGGNISPGPNSPFDETASSASVVNYSTLLDDSASSSASNAVRRQILVDIRRTLPNNVHFGREGRGLTNLYRVLVSFARHKPHLGYCQGINFIAAVLLLLLDNEEDVFWSLVVLTENDRFFGSRQFDSRLTGARADQKLIVNLMGKHLPRLYRHIEKNGTDLSTCFIPWLMCGFYDCVPFRTLLRIWDYFFMTGYSVFYRVAVALMKVQEDSLMEITDATLILKHIKLFPHLCHDFTHLLKVAFEDLQASEPWPSWDDLLNQRRKNIKAIEKQDVAASIALRSRRRTPFKGSLASIASGNASTFNNSAGPTFVTVVEADRCPDVLSASSRLFVWVDDPVSSSSQLYLISTEKSPNSCLDLNSSVGDVLSTTTMPGFPTNESPICATATLLTRLNGQLVLTFTQFRHNLALISTAQSTLLACLDLDNGRVIWSFIPSSANEDDLVAATLLDSKNDIIYMITQFGNVLVLPCNELSSVRFEGSNVEPKQLVTSAFRLLTASPIACAAVLTFSDADQLTKSILLIGAGSFVYRFELDNTPDRTPLQVAKIHIPLARGSESDSKKRPDDDDDELSSVRQIVQGQTSVSADKDMLFWWALCDGSPCLVLYAMHKTNPLHCQILTTLSGTSCSPNCILLLPRPGSHSLSTCEDCQREGGLSFASDNGSANSSNNTNSSPVSSDCEGLLIGWPNGSIFHWQINIDKLNALLVNMPSAKNESHISTNEPSTFPCDCGCVLQPSISMLPSAPKSFQVQLVFQKGAPFAPDSDESGKTILSAVRRALISTFLPSSFSKNKPVVPINKDNSASVPSFVTGPTRFLPTRQSRRMNSRNNSFLYSTKITSTGTKDQLPGDTSSVHFSGDIGSTSRQNSSSGEQPSSSAIEPPPALSNTYTVAGSQMNATAETPPLSSASTPVRECKLNGCFRLVSVSNVFRGDCPVNWMSVTQSHDLGKHVWAFQLEWLVCKENVASSQFVAVLPVDDDIFQQRPFDESDAKKFDTNGSCYTQKTPRSLADCFFSIQPRNDNWRTIYVSMKAPAENKTA